MQRLSRLVVVIAAACFLMQVPMSVNAKEAVKMRSGDLKSDSSAVKAVRPDLVVSKINYSPGKPTVGSQVTLWVFFKNIGQGRAEASVATIDVGWTKPSTPTQFTTNVPVLNPGQEWRYTKKFTYDLAGNHPVIGTADATGKLAESNEGNNTKMKVISVE